MRVRILSRKSGAAAADGPSRTLFYWLIGAFLLTLLPHAAQLPGWLTGSVVLAIGLRCLAEWKRWPLPTTTSTGVVALCLFLAIFLQYHTILGRDAGTALMTGLVTIKFFELRRTRDITLIIFTSYFVVMSALLFSQAIELFVYCLIMMWLLTGILLRTYMGDHADDRLLRMLRGSSIIFLQALPLALLLFFFLPRHSGRFSLLFSQATTGISDTVEPGSIAELATDDSPAMRVTFKSTSIPLASSMYWRAIVLWNFDGKKWTRGPAELTETLRHTPPPHESDLIQQEIVLWPQDNKWLPALDRPVTPAQDAAGRSWSEVLTGDVLRALDQVDYKRHYTVTSALILSDPLPVLQRDAALKLPKIDPRVKHLADDLHRDTPDTSSYIRAVLHYFRSQHFQLSTSPGGMGEDPVAEFLFEKKTGFCEHYASAFAVLMRAAGVPARMVVGYRGGEYNAYGGFYLVSQSNAHAWDEVWVDEKNRQGWKRVDPTSVITDGSTQALAANNGVTQLDDDLSFQFANSRVTFLSGNYLPAWLRHGLRDVALRRQDMEAQWDDWVFSYDPDTQDRLAQALGFRHQGWLVLLAVCVGIAGAGGALTAYFLMRPKRLPPVEQFYAQFCRRMAQRGAPREKWEGPLAYTERLGAQFPAQQEPIEKAGQIVTQSRYGAAHDEPPTRELRTLLAATADKP